MNAYGCWTLFRKEVRRFTKVLGQTVLAPMITAMLYLLVFSHVMRDRVEVYEGVAYTAFLIPGLMMMSVIQNAFANTSSSLTQSKIMGNVVFLLMPPLSSLEIFIAFIGAALLRATLVALGVYVVALVFVPLPLAAPGVLLVMLLLSAGTLAVLGMIAGIVADKFEHLAAFQNFVILPTSFLSGVFYSIHSLPAFWRSVSHYNPFFYMIDGFRYGFFGAGDVHPALSMTVAAISFALISAVCLAMLHRGYKLRP